LIIKFWWNVGIKRDTCEETSTGLLPMKCYFFLLSKCSYWCWETWIKEMMISDSGGINEGKMSCAHRNSASHWSASPIFSVIAVLWISLWFAIYYYCLCSFKSCDGQRVRGEMTFAYMKTWLERIELDWIGTGDVGK